MSHIDSEWHEQEKSTCKAPVPSHVPWCAATKTEQEVDCRIVHGVQKLLFSRKTGSYYSTVSDDQKNV